MELSASVVGLGYDPHATISSFQYRRISKMTYQPKIVGKMVDFETLTLCISLDLLLKFKSNVYLFLQRLSYKVMSIPGENSIPNHHPFSNPIYYSHLVAVGLTSHKIHVSKLT